ncbi:hypothetical protein BAE44_0018388 [Dichanthelium oligosanthes]|uniref:Dilute domain-containing protein n=1 Tax=Dichanthelium oligosanthes TaxID=888268 RepID=A0A1E5V6H4_9POAL|nr:hypothetical protein BAE44_0018388 [Dichanthelium oligosanthes]
MGARDNVEGRDEKKGAGSDYVPARDSFSSQGESRVPRKLSKKETKENSPRMTKSSASRLSQNKLQHKGLNNVQNKSQKQKKTASAAKAVEVKKPEIARVPSRPPSELSEETDDIISDAGTIDDKGNEEAKEIDVLDEAPHCDQSTGTDDDIPDIEEKIVHHEKSVVEQGNEESDSRIDKLEQELREVAALEVSLYSVVPEHGNSAHKLHTPARRLSRLYIHASKFWLADKRASAAKNIASGLVLVAKSSSNDASRLTFWLSNTVVLREIIAQTFGVSCVTPTTMTMNVNGSAKKFDGKSMTMLWRNSSNGKQTKLSMAQTPDDWQETSTLLASLEKIESWIFSRIVETVWWQALTPHMQAPPSEGSSTPRTGRVSGPALGDQQQGTFSVNLWKAAFHDAFSRMCPLRAGGHECGCLPVLAKLVMEQCVARLDVAMFNAILRESASEIPTDPISDPIVDPKVLPIPAGDLSFGSGAQLKNSIGNWSRWLTDKFGIDADDSDMGNDDDEGRGAAESKSFQLLNELSDLLMLPKDMLLEKSIRKEVCPSIGLPLVTRILCNFTPDEFCPDPVPSTVLEELNSESLLERCTGKDVISTFPCIAAPVVYHAPSTSDAAEEVADIGGGAKQDRKALMVQRRGYTSDDDLDDLVSPLASLIDRSTPPSPSNGIARFSAQRGASMENERYTLLREVWLERR